MAATMMNARLGLDHRAAATLCHLRAIPDQRLVFQPGCAPDEDGHQVCPESVFFRMSGHGLHPPGGKPTFRRLTKYGWISPVGEYAGQVEYQLSPEAVRKFDADPAWQRVEDVWRRAAGMPPRLRLVLISSEKE